MRRSDERGQSVVIGSLLIFAILIVAFSAYQAFAVPTQNAQVESQHFQTVEDQFAELRTNVVNAVGSDETRSTAIDLGVRYPSRAVALNPPPAAGQLETTERATVSIPSTSENVCRRGGGTAYSRTLEYDPGYNEFRQPESIGYENRLVARQFEDGSLFDQRLVRSGSPTEIDLYLLTGEVDVNGVDAYSLEVNASDAYTTTLTDPTIIVPSRFDAGTWNDTILDERDDVTADPVAGDDDRVRLEFTGGSYEVSCAVVGLNGEPAFTPPQDSDGGGGDTAMDVSADLDYGIGGTSHYDTDTDTHTVSSRNGLLTGVTAADELVLHDARPVWETNDQADQVEYEIMVENTTTGEFYTVRYRYSKQPGNSPTRTVTIFDRSGNNYQYSTTDETASAVIEADGPDDGADLFDLTSYSQPGSGFNSSIVAIKSMAGPETDVITTSIRGRVDVTIREEALITAVQPAPRQGDDLEFVRVHFETATDATGWVLSDDEGETTTLPGTVLHGNVYFARNESAFEAEYGFDDGSVYPLTTTLENDGDALELVDGGSRSRDEVAYVEGDDGSPTTSNGWRVNDTDTGIVAVRRTNDAGYADNDTRGDWTRVDQNNVFFEPKLPTVAFVPTTDDRNAIRTVNNDSEVVNVSVGTKQVGILGPMADLTNDGTREVPFVDSNNRLKYARSDGTVEVLAYRNQNDRVKAKKQPIGVGRHDGDARPTVYYVNGSNYLYRVQAGGAPSPVHPGLVNGSGNRGTFKPTGVAGLADFDGEGDKEVILVNQSAIAYLDETAGGDTTVRVRDLGTRPPPDGNDRQISQGVGKPVTYDGRVQVPLVDGGVIILVDEDGDVTTVHRPQVTRNTGRDKALNKPIAPRDWDGDGTLEFVYINGQPTTGDPQQSLTLIEVDRGPGDATVRSVYGEPVKAKGAT